MALSQRFLNTRRKLALILYFLMVTHKAACLTLSKAFLKSVEDLLCGAPSCSGACLFFSDDLLCLWLQFVQYDLQHDFAWVTDESDHSVVLALLHVAFLWKCDD